MLYHPQKKLIVYTVLLGSFFSLPFLTYAATEIPITNPGLETASSSDAAIPEHWSKGFWGANDAVFTYPVLGVAGTKAAKVEITNYADGDAKWFFEDIPVTPGEQYVFSDMYLANVPTDVVARYTFSGGGYQYAYLGTPVISTTWTGYATLPFTIPQDIISLTVFHLIHETGSLTIDNVSLRPFEEHPLPPPPVITPNFTTPVAGGAVSLSYITGIKNATPQEIRQAVPVPASVKKEPATIGAVLDKLNDKVDNMGTVTYTRTAEAVNDRPATSFVHSAEAAAETPSNFLQKTNGTAPLGTLVRDFSDLSLAFLGLSLIVFSIGLTLLLGYQNSKNE
jgi:hypothetical protein